MASIRTLLLAVLLLPLFTLAQSGANCINSIPITEGQHTTQGDDYWYRFVPDVAAVYHISTCGLSTCDTKIWVYNYCAGLVVDEGGTNALAYNDDACGLQTQVDPWLTAGATYYIRIGDYQNACAGAPVTWIIYRETTPPAPECGVGRSLLSLLFEPDQFANELDFTVSDGAGTVILSGGYLGGSVCYDSASCVVFEVTDAYGDGIAPPGGIWLLVDSVEVDSIMGNFGSVERRELNCPEGFSCVSAMDVPEGDFTAPTSETWYSFTPAQTGSYAISSCTGNTCDTRIWLYDHCQDLLVTDNNEGTIYYSDNECGQQASIVAAMLQVNQTYWIRIGDVGGSCTGAIDWSIHYNGPVSGCTDINACNYNPFATIDDGSCLQPGDPNCPDGPDLIMVQSDLQNSIYAQTLAVNPSNCYITEGCLNGFGDREIVRFTTHIKNIGTQDYYIGSPGANPSQFTFGNCHGHWHYKGYADYILFDSTGQSVVNGFKNGFCVLDLECSGGGSAQYGCNNMGITAGCGDIYGANLDCQWIDVTGVPEGRYTLVVRCNWDNSPDALGRVELNHVNNWAQVCIEVVRNPGFSVIVDPNCAPYVDCAGIPYGSAQMDCEGVCNGPRLIGDLDVDNDQDYTDAQGYVNGILGSDINALNCNDANADGRITVTDAALVASCHYWNLAYADPDSSGTHDHCNFPKPHVVNPYDSVIFTIGAFDMGQGYLDVYLRNPDLRTVGYELLFSGIEITTVENMADPGAYPVTPQASFGGQRVISVSYVDSSIARSTTFQPVLRVHFMNPQSVICISEVVDVVNENYTNSTTALQDACILSTGLAAPLAASGVRALPNPFVESTVVTFHQASQGTAAVELLDLQGRVVRSYTGVKGGRLVVQRGDLAPGTYYFRIVGAASAAGRLVVE